MAKIRQRYDTARRDVLATVRHVERAIRNHRAAVFVVCLVAIIFYLWLDSHLYALIASLVVAAVTFGWRARILIAVAMIFLLAIPFLLLAQEVHYAEQMVTYAYGTFGVVVLIEFFIYLKESSHRFEENVQGVRKANFFLLFSSIILLLCVALIVGFVYLYTSFRNTTGSSTAREGTDVSNQEEWKDKELEDLKKQLQEAVDFVSQNAYNQMPEEKEADFEVIGEVKVEEEIDEETTKANIQLVVLNGTSIIGEAARLRDELAAKGYTVASVGNADRYDYTDTIIRHAKGRKKEAELLMRDLGVQLAVTLEPDASLEEDTIFIIIGTIRIDPDSVGTQSGDLIQE